MRFSFLDLFSGIGGFRIPLEKNGGICKGHSEIDKNCLKIYDENFKTNGTFPKTNGTLTKTNGTIFKQMSLFQTWGSPLIFEGT